MKLCVAAVFARRTALREQVFLMERLTSDVPVLERIGVRERALFRRFWQGRWDYLPAPALETALGADGVKRVQFNWSEGRALAQAYDGQDATSPERQAEALELVGDCLALRFALTQPNSRELDALSLWQTAKRSRAEARAVIKDFQDRRGPAESALLGAVDAEELALYATALEEVQGDATPEASRRQAAAFADAPPPTDVVEPFTPGVSPEDDVVFADLLVRADRWAEAHALLGQREDSEGLRRRLVLDHAVRLTWLDYDRILDSVADLALEPLIGALRRSARLAGRGVGAERLDAVREQALILGLSSDYGRALEASVQSAVDRPQAALAQWRAAEALAGAMPPVSPAPSQSAVLVLATDEPPSSAWLAHARHLTDAGVTIGLIHAHGASWAEAPATRLDTPEDLATFLEGIGPVLLTLGPQYVSVAHVWAWPMLATPGTPLRCWTDHVAGHVGSLPALEHAYQCAEVEAGLAASGSELDPVALLTAPRAYFSNRFGGSPDRRIATVRCAPLECEADAPPALVVVHDAPVPPNIDFAMPVRFLALGAIASQETDDADLGALGALLTDLPDDTPVLFIARDVPYPPNYARNAWRQFRDLGGLDLSFMAVRRTTHLEGCQPAAASAPGVVRLACLATTCLSVASVRRIAPNLPTRLSTVVDTEEPALLLTPLFDPPFLARFDQRLKRLLVVESGNGVRSIAAGVALSEAALEAMTEPARRLLAPIVRNRATFRALAEHLAEDDFSVLEDRDLDARVQLCRELLDLGYLTVARRAFEHTLTAPSREIARTSMLRALINLSRDLGLQGALAERHRFIVGDLVRNSPSEVGPFFEILATALPQTEVDRALLAALSGVGDDRDDRGLARVLDAVKKYASAPALTWILIELLSHTPKETLNRPNVKDHLRGLAVRADFATGQLETMGLPRAVAKLAAEPPLSMQVRQALAAQDWGALADAVNGWIGRDLPLSELIKEVRTHSDALSGSDLANLAGHYRVYDTPEARLMFAAVIGDTSYLQHAVQEREGDASIVARARLGRFDWLEDRLEELGGPLGLKSPSFDPTSIQDIFRSVIAARSQRPGKAAKMPRVTAVMTLFDPDLDLLGLSIESVLTQEGVEVELVVIDDGSAREIREAIEALLAGRAGVILERSAINAGPYACRNRALELASGAFIAIQDGDDVSHPARFRTQIAALEAGGDATVMATTGHLRFDAGGRPQFEYDLSLIGDGTMTSMFRREVFETVGRFTRVRSRGDVEMRERIRAALGAGAVAHIDYPMVYCNGAPDTLSNRTARQLQPYLTLFRNNYARQHRHLRQAISMGEPVVAPDTAVPAPLRP